MSMTNGVIEFIVNFATGKMVPLMFLLFGMGIVFRVLLFYTIKREEWFTKEFEKRVESEGENRVDGLSFFGITRKVLEQTYYEIFEIRSIMKRRKPDVIMTFTDRVFLIQQGSARFIRDIMARVKGLRFSKNDKPNFEGIAKNAFERNACFSKVFGIIPTTLVNDILVILPGIFIVLGILGTFLGIMKALPEIGNIDFSNIAGSQETMDKFLVKISFSMRTSIIGIIFSVACSILNSILGVEKIYGKSVERFVSSLDLLWNYADTNEFSARLTEDEINAGKSLDKELGEEEVERINFKRAA